SYLESDSARQEYGNIINEIISSTSDSETRSRLSSYNQEVQANTSSSSSSTSSSNSSGTHNPSSSSGNSGTPKTGSGYGTTSSAQTAAAKAKAQIQQDYAQAVTKALQLQKEQAMKKLVQITENYQKSVKEREEKKAKEAQAQKTDSAKTNSSSGSKTSNVSEKKSSDEIAETFTTSASASSSISEEKREELRQAYQSGGAASLYEKLGSVSTTYQEQFLNYFAQHANTADLCSFASSHSGNKNVILTLYQRSNDPALLQYLGEANIFDLLGKGKIKLQDFLRYATPDMVAKYLQNMQQVGNLNAIKEVTSMMSLTQREEISQGFIEQAENKAPVPGSDEWLKAQQENMSDASIATPEQNDNQNNQKISGGAMLSLDDEKENSTSAMLSLNDDDENDFGGSFGSNKVRMGLDIKKRDKRFYRMG
ncbi:hypothetical protein IJ596_06685, partial [bacterium]|nr:hypothetical protein [bacterium]